MLTHYLRLRQYISTGIVRESAVQSILGEVFQQIEKYVRLHAILRL